MNYVILSSIIVSILIAVALITLIPQHVQAQANIKHFCIQNPDSCIFVPLKDPCIQNPDDCIYVPIDWWKGKFKVPDLDDCIACNLLNLNNILSIPDNQSFNIRVQHGNLSDTVIIEIPKALTNMQ
jgi:hypothetical protein